MNNRRVSFNLNALQDLIADWQSNQPNGANRKIDFHNEMRLHIENDGYGELDWLKRALKSSTATPEKIKTLEAFFSRVPGYLANTTNDADAQIDSIQHTILDDGRWSTPATWTADSWLLRPEYATVPFHDIRGSQIEDLMMWSCSEASDGVCLLFGRGGIGKTRLAMEFIRKLKAENWIAGFLKTRETASINELICHQNTQVEPVMIAIDYAELRINELAQLFELLAQHRERKTRVLLLARAKSEWWQSTCRKSAIVQKYLADNSTYMKLVNFPVDESIRKTLFESACRAFSKTLSKPLPQVGNIALSSSEFSTPLFLHIAALAAVRGKPVVKGDEMLNDLIQRESRVWYSRANSVGLQENVVGPLIAQSVALITLIGGCDNVSSIRQEISNVPLAKGLAMSELNILAQILAETYPESGSLGALKPDVIGEHLVDIELSKDPILYTESFNVTT